LSWTAPLITGDTAITTYTVSGGGTAVVSGTTATVTGLSSNTSYDFVIAAINSVGSGVSSRGSSILTLNFNEATGGTVTTVSNYNGTGHTFQVHTFTSGGTLVVLNGNSPFSVLLVGNGGGGGGVSNQAGGGGGGGGGVYTNATMTMSPGSYPVGVSHATLNGQTGFNGGGGQGWGNGQVGGTSGSPTAHSGGTPNPIYEGSGGGGAGGVGGNANGNGGGGGGGGVSRNTSGTASTYGSGGPGGGGWQNGTAGQGFPGSQTGGVIVAYRII